MFKTLELPGGFAPLDPLPGLCPGPTGGLKRPQTPRPIILHPPFLIHGYGPVYVRLFQGYLSNKQTSKIDILYGEIRSSGDEKISHVCVCVYIVLIVIINHIL